MLLHPIDDDIIDLLLGEGDELLKVVLIDCNLSPIGEQLERLADLEHLDHFRRLFFLQRQLPLLSRRLFRFLLELHRLL